MVGSTAVGSTTVGSTTVGSPEQKNDQQGEQGHGCQHTEPQLLHKCRLRSASDLLTTEDPFFVGVPPIFFFFRVINVCPPWGRGARSRAAGAPPLAWTGCRWWAVGSCSRQNPPPTNREGFECRRYLSSIFPLIWTALAPL